MSLMYFCFYPAFQWDNIVGNLLPKAGVQKKYKKGGRPCRRVVYRSRGSNFLHTDIERLKGGALES